MGVLIPLADPKAPLTPEFLEAQANRVGTAGVPEGIEVLGRTLIAVRGLAAAASDYARRIEGAMADQMQSKLVVIENVGAFERRKAKDRKAWDHKGIARELVRVANEERIDKLTGEIRMSEGDAVAHTIISCAGIAYWKITDLKGRGIDPDVFCEVSPGRVSVQVVG